MRARSTFTSVRTEGSLLPADILQRIAAGDPKLKHLTPNDYHLPPGVKLNEAISRSWSRLVGTWAAFRDALAKAKEARPGDPATGLSRDRWLFPLFQELGYGRLQPAKGLEAGDRSYPVSHLWQKLPIHLVGAGLSLDQRTAGVAGAARVSPHGLVQELLNRSEHHLWAFVSNGLRLRILRDNLSLTRQAFVEFDLETMMDGEQYADFALLWLVCHQSRVEGERPEEFVLERWSTEASEQGVRVLDDLRQGVETAIAALGAGFLQHPANAALREHLRAGELPTQDYYRQLLRLAYRLLFLLVAEDRDLLHPPDAPVVARERYARFYSTARLRELAERRRGSRHADLWVTLRLVLGMLGDPAGCPELGLPCLGGFLFSSQATPDVNGADLANGPLLDALRALTLIQVGGARRRVDFANLGAEEFGSIYESLLELHPRLDLAAGTFELATAGGHERKTTGSYYTPTSLITCLLESALDPVIEERLVEARRMARGEWGAEEEKQHAYSVVLGSRGVAAGQPLAAPDLERAWLATPLATRYSLLAERALLSLRVCDSACGSGHFLIAAGHRIARRLAAVRTGEDEPSPEAVRTALRDVVGRCLYGVDINPMAVELTKVALWMEALEPGKPLSFLDHHIQCGNSLLGATPRLLAEGIPDAAFNPIEGDDREVCRELKKRNKDERETRQKGLFALSGAPWARLGDLQTELAALDALPDATPAEVAEKERRFRAMSEGDGYLYTRLWADAWCAAFVAPKTRDNPHVVTEDVFRRLEASPWAVERSTHSAIRELADQYRFFHWHLAFPTVFRIPGENERPENEQCGWSGGFDVNLGNPPWEHTELKEKEFFAERRPDIANARTGAERKRAIAALKVEDGPLHADFCDALREHDGAGHFLGDSGRYPLCGRGRINLYAVFSELKRSLIAPRGRLGCIVPSGIATDDTTKLFFQDLLKTRSLVNLYDFENREALFPGVHRSYKFCLLTLSGSELPPKAEAQFVFFALSTAQLRDEDRRIRLSAGDIELLNPNTHTCPIFRSRADAVLTKAIYRRIPVLIREAQDERPEENPWRISFRQGLFNMTSSSGLFRTAEELESVGFVLRGNHFGRGQERFLPLYEQNLIHLYNHRFASFRMADGTLSKDTSKCLAEENLLEPSQVAIPRYWVGEEHVAAASGAKGIGRQVVLGFRRSVRSTDVRTSLFCVLPVVGIGDSVFLLLCPEQHASNLLAALDSHVFDFATRQSLGGENANFFIMKQLPVPLPFRFGQLRILADGTDLSRDGALRHVLELIFTAWDLEGFARDLGYAGPPFRWDEERRILLRCELDAAFFHLYLPIDERGGWRPSRIADGDVRDESAEELAELVRHFPTPRHAVEHVMETFPIVKRKDEAKHGEYRTKRVILEIYDAMTEAIRTGHPYQTRLDPPPADPRCAHPESTRPSWAKPLPVRKVEEGEELVLRPPAAQPPLPFPKPTPPAPPPQPVRYPEVARPAAEPLPRVADQAPQPDATAGQGALFGAAPAPWQPDSRPHVWLALARWATDKNLFDPSSRQFARDLAKSLERQRPLHDLQLKRARWLWTNALRLGFQPDTTGGPHGHR